MKKKLVLPVIAALLLALCACGGPAAPGGSQAQATPSQSQPAPAASQPDEGPSASQPSARITTDPSGASISVPETVDSIVVLAPSLSETVVALGQGDKIVGCDLQSVGLEGLPEGMPTFDLTNPDVEQLVALSPDLLLVSALSLYDQEAPYQPLIDAGVCVACVPTSDSIEDVKSDVRFLAAVLGVSEKGEELVTELETALDELAAAVAEVPEEERKTVYFEISPAPYMYSTGSGTYLHEMIAWAGGVNVLSDQSGWLSVEGESIVAADPDVIFTNVNYVEGAVEEILGRDGWAGVSAVQNGAVYYIDNMSSSLPNQNIIIAMRQMAAALYPDRFPEG